MIKLNGGDMMRNILRNISRAIYMFKEQEHNFIFDGEEGRLLEVSDAVFEILHILSSYNLENDTEYESFIKRITDTYGQEVSNSAFTDIKSMYKNGSFVKNNVVYDTYKKEYDLGEKESYKGGLWLNISHDCNMRCSYCYAQGGNYGAHSQLMTEEIAQKCINYWYDNIDKSKKFFEVVFFGGEPLFNQKVFFYIIKKINNIISELGANVRYTMATNGTIINEDILNVIKENNFNLSISNDGMKHIHDRNRPYVSGRQSYDDVIRNILEFQKVNNNLVVNMVVVKDMIPFVEESVKELWEKGVQSVNVSLCMDNQVILTYEDLKMWNEQITHLAEITFQNIISGKKQYLSNIYDSILSFGKSDGIGKCSLFNNGVFVFAPNGDVYKCHRNVGKEKYKLANINDENLNLLQYRMMKPKIEKCTRCWAKTLCDDGCPYEHELYTGDMNTPAQIVCDKTKIIQEEVIKAIAKLYIKNRKNTKKV